MPSLAVPFRQQIGIGYCLPACVQMVLAYYGTERSQAEIARQLTMIPKVGVPVSRVARLSSKQWHISRRVGELDDLTVLLAQGIPPIIEVATGFLSYWNEDTDHVIVLAVSDGEDAVVLDPAFGAPRSLKLNELALAWMERDNYFIEMRPTVQR